MKIGWWATSPVGWWLVAHVSRGPYLPSFGRCGSFSNNRLCQSG